MRIEIESSPNGNRRECEVVIRGRLSRDIVEEISKLKGEPDWMLRLRLRALELFERHPWPKWLPLKGEIDLESLAVYARPNVEKVKSWDELPPDLKRQFESLKIPELEAKALAGVLTQVDSEIIYEKLKKEFERLGISAMSMDEAVKRYPDLVKRYFARVLPPEYKFAALNVALWSGGVFIYVPPNVKVDLPLEFVLFISAANIGQFEHSLVIVDENSSVNLILACTAPVLKGESIHVGVTEIYAHKGSRVKIIGIKNWSENIIYLGNARAIAEDNAKVEFVVGMLGARFSAEYPSVVLRGRGSSTNIFSVVFSSGNTWKEEGVKIFHSAPETRSYVISKGVAMNGGTAVYRGTIYITRGSKHATSHVVCDSLILDEKSRAISIPHEQVLEETAVATHEAYAGRINEEALAYLRMKGLNEEEAKSLVTLGYFEDILSNLPFEYASLFKRVLELKIKGESA